MIAYHELLNLLINFIDVDINSEFANEFCKKYMDLFFELSNTLEREVSQQVFELFDEINLICDSFEINIEIRIADKYCIDETELKKKIIKFTNLIKGY